MESERPRRTFKKNLSHKEVHVPEPQSPYYLEERERWEGDYVAEMRRQREAEQRHKQASGRGARARTGPASALHRILLANLPTSGGPGPPCRAGR